MNYVDKIQLRKEILESWKQIMSPLYKEWRHKYPSDEVRLETLKILEQHTYEKTVQSLRRKVRKKRNKVVEKDCVLAELEDF